MLVDNNIYQEGKVLLIDKPLHWTSFDVVKKVRNLIRVKKVGHAGTLDPLATGLLIICTGKYTKRINEYMAKEKEYTGTFTLGATTSTYDLESDIIPAGSYNDIDIEKLKLLTLNFTGSIMQVPPAHSAIKQNGKRVYELARKGENVQLEPRPICIHSFLITAYHPPVVHFTVICSTGTYIRSLAHDFGQALGCGAYLSSLRRTRIGSFNVTDAFTIENFEAMINKSI